MKKSGLLKQMIQSYHLWLGENQVIREVVRHQEQGRFSPTRVEIGHYYWFAYFATTPSVLKSMPDVIHVLDVGAYLNLFANFLNNIQLGAGKCFECSGLEMRPEYCELSNRIFRNNRIVCGNAMDMDRLFDEKFDMIIFCNFFHWHEPQLEETIRLTLGAADNILNPGGMIAIRSPDERRIHSRSFFLPSADAGLLSPGGFMPSGYTYSDRSNADCWFIARKNST